MKILFSFSDPLLLSSWQQKKKNIQDDNLNGLGRWNNMRHDSANIAFELLWNIYIHINIYFWS